MDEFKKFCARTRQNAVKIAAFVLCAVLLFLPLWPGFIMRISLGLLLGFGISIMVFRMKVRGLLQLARMGPEQAKKFAVSRSFFRYGLMVIAVIAAAKSGLINPVACVLGLFLVNGVIVASIFIDRLERRRPEYGD